MELTYLIYYKLMGLGHNQFNTITQLDIRVVFGLTYLTRISVRGYD